ARGDPAQRREMRAGAERGTNVLAERADIRAFAAADAQLGQRRAVGEQLELGNLHATRSALHRAALARELVERYAVALQRRMHRRYLVDRAAEALEHRRQLARAGIHRTHLQHLALGVAGTRAAAQRERREIFLVGIEQWTGELGRLAEEQHQ